MKVLINAVSVREGGPLVVLRQLCETMLSESPALTLHVACPRQTGLSLAAHASLHVIERSAPASPIAVLRWYEHDLPDLARESGVDVLFSMTNYLPTWRRLPCAAVLLVQHAGYFSPDFIRLQRAVFPSMRHRMSFNLKGQRVRASIRVADRVLVQTSALAAVIRSDPDCDPPRARSRLRNTRPDDRIHAVAHGPGVASLAAAPRTSAKTPANLGFLSKFGVQKGFHTLLAGLPEVQRHHAFTLHLTLDLDDAATAVLQDAISAAPYPVSNKPVRPDEVPAALERIDICIFTSICESFGFPLVEAMARGIPVVAVDVPGNRELAGNAALYFAMNDSDGLAARTRQLLGDTALYHEMSKRALARSRDFSWQSAARETLAVITAAAAERDLQTATRGHYDDHPFEFLTPTDEANIEAQQPPAFARFAGACLQPGDHVADVGCGPGRASLYLARLGHDAVCIDLSLASLQLARHRAPTNRYINASNLNLPVASESFDAVISDGVIHHTPDPRLALCENLRLLRPGGRLYLAVYRRDSYYYHLFTRLGPLIRKLEAHPASRWLITGVALPVYYLVHLIKSRGRRSYAGARSFFYDYIITPQASFHSSDEIHRWVSAAGAKVIDYVPRVGNTVHAFTIAKRQVGKDNPGPDQDSTDQVARDHA